MSSVLYVQASPRAGRSHSIAVADTFIEAYRQIHSGDTVITVDLFRRELPAFDGPALQAKYRILHGEERSPEEHGAWRAVEAVIDEFKRADKYVFAVPMWNFHIPYRMKHYLDILIQPAYTFTTTPEGGYAGLVTGKPVLVVCARGGEYPPGSPAEAFDFQTAYLKMILGFIGLTDVRFLRIEPTLSGGRETAMERRRDAAKRAQEMAGSF